MVVRGQLGLYRFCESDVKCREGTVGVYRFREAGVKWW